MISIQLIKKWKNMLLKKSVFHVNQTVGHHFSKSEIEGYYNNLTDKVRYTTLFDSTGIPLNVASFGEQKKEVYFPIAIFQFGLGACDLYLETGDEKYKALLVKMCDWAVMNQQNNGAWNTFDILNYSNPWSSMAQGEGISLLLRGWKQTGISAYLDSALLAAEFMLLPVENGGTAVMSETELILLEYPNKPTVLNGWIFSAFGLYDLWLVTGDKKWLFLWKKALKGICQCLPVYDSGHWSYYDDNRKFTSPFYHKLHIELLKAVYELEADPVIETFIKKWTRCGEHWFWRRAAFLKKAIQKLTEKKKDEWVLTG